MAATTLDRNTARKYVERTVAEDALLAATTTIPAGALVATNANGELIHATDAAGATVIGRAPRRMVNAGGAAAKITPKAYAEAGIFKYGTTGGSAIVAGDIGKNSFVLDNQTVVKTGGTTNAIVAGVVDSIDPDGGIWVKVNC
jgi:hypothetical protein